MFTAILPIKNEDVAAITPTNETKLIDTNINIIIIVNSTIVPPVIGPVLLSQTSTALWKHKKTVRAGKIDIIIRGWIENSLSELDKPEILINQILDNGVNATRMSISDNMPPKIIANLFNE